MPDAVKTSACCGVLKALQKLCCTKPRAARDGLWGLCFGVRVGGGVRSQDRRRQRFSFGAATSLEFAGHRR